MVADVEKSRSKLVRMLEGMSGMATLGTGYAVAHPAAFGQPASDQLRGLIRSVVEDTAAAGGVMIVSHAASLALAGNRSVLRVLITAPPEVRSERLAQSGELDGDE